MDARLTFGVFLWLILLALALFPALRKTDLPEPAWRNVLIAFLCVLVVALPVWRLRSLLYTGEINVDESQILAQALRYKMDPIPWRSVDGGSGGPLYTWSVMWVSLLGLKLDYFAARLTSLLCFLGLLVGIILSLIELVPRRMALLFSLPAVTLVLYSLNLDYVFYSSEQLPSAAMAWVVFLILRQVKHPTILKSVGIGFLTGARPFCKIQVGPAGVYLWLTALAITLYRHRSIRSAGPYLFSLVAGGLAVPLLILIPVCAAGTLSDFWHFYIQSSIYYKSSTVAEPTLSRKIAAFSTMFTGIWEFRAFWSSILVLGCLSLAQTLPDLRRRWSPLGGIGLACFAGLALILTYSIYRTGYLFPHYTLFLILPFSLLPGAAFLPKLKVEPAAPSSHLFIVLAAIFPAAIQWLTAIPEFSNPRNKPFLGDWGPGVPPIGEYFRNLVPPGGTMLVWGYAPKFHVFSQVPSAVRTACPINLLGSDPSADNVSRRFHEAFYDDLKKYAPAIFVDAPDEFVPLDPNYPRGVMARHNLVKPVAEIIRNDYEFQQQIPSMPGKVPILIYRRKSGVSSAP